MSQVTLIRNINTLTGLTDVTATAPVSGDILTFSGSSWANQQNLLEYLGDVDLTGAVSGYLLTYNGTSWVPLAGDGVFLPLAGGTMSGSIAMAASATVDGVDVSEIPSTYLPLAGGTMTGSIDLNHQDITNIHTLAFDMDHSVAPSAGGLSWNQDDLTLNLGLPDGGSPVTLQIGQEMLIRVRNRTGAQLYNGQVVYINGAQANRTTVALSCAASGSTFYSHAMLTEDLSINETGYATLLGLVRDLDTSAYDEGTILWLSDTSSGGWTDTKPVPPSAVVRLGVVTVQGSGDGAIYFDPQPGGVFSDIQGVSTVGAVTGDALVYNGAGLWVPGVPGEGQFVPLGGGYVSDGFHLFGTAPNTAVDASTMRWLGAPGGNGSFTKGADIIVMAGSGYSNSGDYHGGDLYLYGGNSSGSGTSGTVVIIGGASSTQASGGAVYIKGGDGLSAAGPVVVQSDLEVTGKLTVAGLIDPTGLVLDPQASNPIQEGSTGFWVDSGTNAPMFYNGTSTVPLTATLYLDDLGDVDTTGVSSGDVLTYSGTSWVPAQSPAPDLSGYATLSGSATWTGAPQEYVWTPPGSSQTTVLEEDFESALIGSSEVVTDNGSDAPPIAWVQAGSGDVTDIEVSAHSGTHFLWFDSYDHRNLSQARYSWDSFDATSLSNLAFSFWMFHLPADWGATDAVQVQVSLNEGVNWLTIGSSYFVSSGDGGWMQHDLSLAAYDGQASVKVGLLATSRYNYSTVIDDVSVTSSVPASGWYGGINLYTTNASSQVDELLSVTQDTTKNLSVLSDGSIYASGGFFGDVTGNVTGNVTGDLTGTASLASAVAVAGTADNTEYPVLFGSAASGPVSVRTAAASASFTYNPFTNTLYASTLSASNISLNNAVLNGGTKLKLTAGGLGSASLSLVGYYLDDGTLIQWTEPSSGLQTTWIDLLSTDENTSLIIRGAQNNSYISAQFRGNGDVDFYKNVKFNAGAQLYPRFDVVQTSQGSGDPYAVSASTPGLIVHNSGASALVCCTLPSATAGDSYTFTVVSSGGIRVTPQTGDTITIGQVSGGDGNYVQSTTSGDSVTLTALDGTLWFATAVVGSGWAAET